MKKIIEDFLSENFSKEDIVRYGIIVPGLYVLIMLLAGLME